MSELDFANWLLAEMESRGMSQAELSRRGRKNVTLLIEWDHKLPYSCTQNNRDENFAAACQVCNGLKSAFVFQTVDEAKLFLDTRRKEKGYDW